MKIAIVGAGGYGNFLLRNLDETLGLWSDLGAVIDPFAQSAPLYERLVAEHIPIYPTLEAFYEKDGADLVVIASPIAMHEPQTMTALANGSHVLCEKPLVPTLQQANRLIKARKDSGRMCGVGFQWSFSSTMQAVKRDILSGKLGAPISMQSKVSWPRPDQYYEGSTWKGRVRDAQGNWVLDSIATNACAHYLHNLFFLMGDDMHAAAMPREIEGLLLRARDIESFDTCFLRGAFENGATFGYYVSHVGEVVENPMEAYVFENATVSSVGDTGEIIAVWKDGTQTSYGNINKPLEIVRKIPRMMEAIEKGGEPDCGIETILPHLTVSNALFDNIPIQDVPASARTHNETGFVVVHGMNDTLRRCFEEKTLPDAIGCEWAGSSTQVSLQGIDSFSGRLL